MKTSLTVDKTLNIKPVAWRILRELSKEPLVRFKKPHSFFMETSAWYNGRERGIVLTLGQISAKDFLIVVFSECRNSDGVVIYTWHQPYNINPPTVRDLTDEVYQKRQYIQWSRNQVPQVANLIRAICRSYVRGGLETEYGDVGVEGIFIPKKEAEKALRYK